MKKKVIWCNEIIVIKVFAILIVTQTVHSFELDDNNSRIRRQACGSNQFQCNSGQCIYDENKCDGTAQCNDQSDETKETCSGFVCPRFTYTCAYGACVDADSKCNGVKECFDGSDEDPKICQVDQKPTPSSGI